MEILFSLGMFALAFAWLIYEQETNLDLLKEKWQVEDENGDLQELVAHCWVHSGHENCGYDQMTSEQKALFDRITKRDAE